MESSVIFLRLKIISILYPLWLLKMENIFIKIQTNNLLELHVLNFLIPKKCLGLLNKTI